MAQTFFLFSTHALPLLLTVYLEREARGKTKSGGAPPPSGSSGERGLRLFLTTSIVPRHKSRQRGGLDPLSGQTFFFSPPHPPSSYSFFTSFSPSDLSDRKRQESRERGDIDPIWSRSFFSPPPHTPFLAREERREEKEKVAAPPPPIRAQNTPWVFSYLRPLYQVNERREEKKKWGRHPPSDSSAEHALCLFPTSVHCTK